MPTSEPLEVTVTGQVLTDEDIANSYSLQKQGALAGDEWANDSLVRKVSEAPKGEILTEYDISRSPRLREIGAEVGDQLVDNTLVKTAENAPLRNFQYFYNKTASLTENMANYLESKMPLGRVNFSFDSGLEYISPEELGYADLPEQERRDKIQQLRDQYIEEQFADLIPEQASVSGIGGTVAGALDVADLLIPAKRLITGGAAAGGAWQASEQLAKTGEVEANKELATAIGAGALGGGAVKVAAPVVKAGAQKLATATTDVAKATPSVVKSVLDPVMQAGKAVKAKSSEALNARKTTIATKKLSQVERAMQEKVAKGKSQAEAVTEALKESKLTQSELQTMIQQTGIKPAVPATQDKARKLVQAAIENDSTLLRQVSKTADDVFGVLSTRIGNISKSLLGRLRKFEFDAHSLTSARTTAVSEFTETVSKLDPSVKRTLGAALSNGRYKQAETILTSATDNVTAKRLLTSVRSTLKNTYDDLKSVGRDFNEKENYFPRIVKDYDGLSAELGAPVRNQIDKALETFAKQHGTTVAKLSETSKAHIYNNIILKKVNNNTSAFKSRKLEELPERYLKYYYSPEESLNMYLRHTANDVARRRLFGAETIKKNEIGEIDISETIGGYVNRMLDNGEIDAKQAEELFGLLEARFKGGDTPMNEALAVVRDANYAVTITNPLSALTQFQDLSHAARLYGLRNTVRTMFGNKNIKAIDLGLERTITDEMTNVNKSGRMLNSLFRKSGFAAVDRLGKETTINAGINRLRAQANSPDGLAKLEAKYGEMFGERFGALVDDLQSGRTTELVKELSFNVLSDLQPITRLENPYYYNKTPAARMVYQLKSFTLKQFDIVRREVIQEASKGNTAEATRNALYIGGYLSAAGVPVNIAKDMLLGRDVNPDDIPEKAMWSLFSVFAMSPYTYDKLERKDLAGVTMGVFGPPIAVGEALFNAASEAGKVALTGEPSDRQAWMRSIPIAGPFLYNWIGGGAEAYNKKKEQEVRKERGY